MEHMAPIAGTASSVQGVVTTLGAAAIGFAIGQAFDGTVIPYLIGVAGCGSLSFVIVMLTEPKRLFAPISVERGATLEAATDLAANQLLDRWVSVLSRVAG